MNYNLADNNTIYNPNNNNEKGDLVTRYRNTNNIENSLII